MDERVLKSLILPIDDGQGNVDDVKYLIPQGTVTEADLEEAEGTKADAIVRSASGDIASYDDGGDLPMKSLKVNIVPKQSGTGDPSPSNVRPISGTDEVGIVRSAFNLWDEEWEVGAFGTMGATLSTTHAIRSKNFIPVRPLTEYRLLWGSRYGTDRSYSVMIIGYNKNKVFAQNIYRSKIENAEYYVFTVPSGVDYIKISVGDWVDTVVVTNYANDISVNYPSTDTEYHKGATPEEKSITLPQTVYGGTLDVTKGEGDDGMYYINLGDITWTGGSTGTFTGSFTNYPYPWKYGLEMVCEQYKFDGYRNSQTGYTLANNTFAYYCINGGTQVREIYIRDERFAGDLAGFQAAMDGVYVCVPKNVKGSYNTTPTEVKSLLGDNNVWSESGTVDVEYRADTSLVINKILEALA